MFEDVTRGPAVQVLPVNVCDGDVLLAVADITNHNLYRIEK